MVIDFSVISITCTGCCASLPVKVGSFEESFPLRVSDPRRTQNLNGPKLVVLVLRKELNLCITQAGIILLKPMRVSEGFSLLQLK